MNGRINKQIPSVDAAVVRASPPLYQLIGLILEQRGELKIIRKEQKEMGAGTPTREVLENPPSKARKGGYDV